MAVVVVVAAVLLAGGAPAMAEDSGSPPAASKAPAFPAAVDDGGATVPGAKAPPRPAAVDDAPAAPVPPKSAPSKPVPADETIFAGAALPDQRSIGSGDRRAILVVGSTRPPTGDRAIIDLALSRGFELLLVDDDSDLAALDLTGADLLMISSSVIPRKVGSVFADAAVPVVTWEPYVFDDMAMSGSRETSRRYRTITIAEPTHPIAAGLGAGPAIVHTVAMPLSFGSPGSEAEVIAHVPSRPDRAVVFAYEAGDALIDGEAAPAARVGLFPTYQGARRLSSDGLAVIAAALDWAAPPPSDGPVNDDFVDRLPLTDVASGTNVDASLEPVEPIPDFEPGFPLPAEGSVWWTYTATEDSRVSITTLGSDFDTILAVWSGDELSSLTAVAVNDDSLGALHSTVEFDAAAGSTYQVAVYGFAGARGDIELSLTVQVPPANDDFADRLPLTDAASGTNLGASLEPAEPLPEFEPGFPFPAEASVWWSYTATESGPISISTFGSDFDTILGVWVGDELASLAPVAVNDDSALTLQSRVVFEATAGTTYQVAVYGFAIDRGSIQLAATLLVPPVNDDFADRVPLVDSVSGTNLGASLEPGEPVPDPGFPGFSLGASVWWTFTATESGVVTITSQGSAIDPFLAVWSGDEVSALDLVAQEPDVFSPFGSVVFEATAGATYQVAAYGVNGDAGEVVLTVLEPPVNDDFADRLPLVDVASGTNLGASLEPGEPVPDFEPGLPLPAEASVWWSYTATETGPVGVSTFGSDFDTILSVWRGDELSSLTPVASNDNSFDGLHSTVEFEAVAGSTYQVAVYGFAGDRGSIGLSVRPLAPPTNDDFADRLPLTDSVSGVNFDARVELDEPLPEFEPGFPFPAERSVWWSYTATETGPVSVSTAGSDFDTILAVWRGDELPSLAPVAVNDDSASGLQSTLVFEATAGTTYQVAVYGFAGAQGSIQLAATPLERPVNDDFADRVPLVDSVSGTNLGASLEPGEPAPDPGFPGVSLGASVWWTFTATESGVVTITSQGSAIAPFLAVWSGDDVSALDLVAQQPDVFTPFGSVVFEATAGASYQVAAYGVNGAVGEVVLTVLEPPVNDDFADRLPLVDFASGTNLGASLEPGEPVPDFEPGFPLPAEASVWWSYTATETGPVGVSTFGSDFDTIVGVWRGDELSSLTPVASNDDSPDGLDSTVAFDAVAGTTYQVAVYGFGSARGNVELAVAPAAG